MENLPALSNAKLPSYLSAFAAEPSAITTALAMGDTASVPRISLKQGRFRIREGKDEFVLDTPHLDAVIVGVVPGVSKMFYAKAWNPNDEPTAPDCYSILGDVPASEIKEPVASSCADCPNNVWGSKVTPQGTEIKACSDSIRIAIVPADDPSKVYLLVVPAASMKFLRKYVKELALRGYKPEIVRTRMTFDSNASFPLLQFAFAGFAAEAVIEELVTTVGSVEVNDVLGLGVSAGVARPALRAPAPTTTAKMAPLGPPLSNEHEMNPATQPQAQAEAAPKRSGFGRPPGAKNRPKAAEPVQEEITIGFGKPAAAKPVATAPDAGLAELESQIDSLLS